MNLQGSFRHSQWVFEFFSYIDGKSNFFTGMGFIKSSIILKQLKFNLDLLSTVGECSVYSMAPINRLNMIIHMLDRSFLFQYKFELRRSMEYILQIKVNPWLQKV